MKVAADTVVTLNYDLCLEDGEIVESSDISGAVTYLHGSKAILPGLDARLEGLETGDERTFEFPPSEAFGTVDDAPRKSIPRSEFPAAAALTPGMSFEAGVGAGQTIQLQVVKADDANVEVRMIHPLAGKTLSMSVKVVAVREATAKEREMGRALTKPPPVRRG